MTIGRKCVVMFRVDAGAVVAGGIAGLATGFAGARLQYALNSRLTIDSEVLKQIKIFLDELQSATREARSSTSAPDMLFSHDRRDLIDQANTLCDDIDAMGDLKLMSSFGGVRGQLQYARVCEQTDDLVQWGVGIDAASKYAEETRRRMRELERSFARTFWGLPSRRIERY